ncbi:hypothetical protein BHE97_06490 [Aeromicrobium sp. PE09-221]|uniref:hypothetical protein n=1 Tax=Aeromicrobium sp. PE09-221 TaxID=1898043 RepID=UPI000B3E656C|nr:hypothetical protein [Aeromicrobium sp. PE09-221]OUZ11070.1 hypothetical protein BHE97_06490 [Aeromicrobium sp. PE09-221]
MLSPTLTRPHPRRLLVLAATGVSVALMLGAIAISFDSRPSEPTTRPGDSTVPLSSAAPSNADVRPAVAVPRNGDPRQFVRDVAAAIFAWDTRTASGPAELIEPFLTIADPTGESSPGLVSDLAGYLPTHDAWVDLRRYQTQQRLEVTTVAVPELWATAIEQAGGELAPGTAAFTVRGIRHRAGSWEGDLVRSKHPVAFTVFVVCAPTYPTCHLLRLSRLDDPLE